MASNFLYVFSHENRKHYVFASPHYIFLITEAANAEKGMKIKGTKAADYDNPEAYGVVLTGM